MPERSFIRLWTIGLLLGLTAVSVNSATSADEPHASITLSDDVQQQCLSILREGMHSDEFWPSIHAAEGLTLAGRGDEVIAFLKPKLPHETDSQQRCGIARELVRAGDWSAIPVLLDVLHEKDPYGHTHAAESLYKIKQIGDGSALRHVFDTASEIRLKLMAAGALGRCGNPLAMAFLRESLNHDDPQYYHIAAWILGRIGNESDIPRLQAQLDRTSDPFYKAYIQHSLAALGDASGMQALGQNLSSEDARIRTYAATFAGDARAVQFQKQLEELLDDDHLDARLRAAQSLMELAGPPRPDSHEDIAVMVYPSNAEQPRHTEGSVVALNDGTLLYAVTQFQSSTSDFAKARIIARRSSDQGRTWDDPTVLQENTGAQNVMSVTLRRLQPPAPAETIAFFYLEKNGYDELNLLARYSKDEAQNFGDAVRTTPEKGYHVVNNDRVLQLSSGRLLVPAASTPNVKTDGHFVSHCYLSDDGGQTWRPGKESVDLAKRGAMEPDLVELNDGRVMMIMRTQLGDIARSYSTDGGDTWSAPDMLGLKAPESPATIRRIPSTGDLMLIWNDTFNPQAGHGGQRTPLSVAISSDEGQTWKKVDNLEEDPNRTFSYVSLIFVQDRAVMTYWVSGPEPGWLSSKFRSLPVSWFYR